MNVYDFDGTIYDGDSTLDFYLFVLKNKPSLICCIPRQLYGYFLYKLNKINKTQFKERFFCFLNKIDASSLLGEFWNKYEKRILPYYLAQQSEDDIVISASPEFLLEPICNRLGIKHLVASKVDVCTGKFYGENCRGEEKVRRFNELYPNAFIDAFYTDSMADLPLIKLSKQSYIVKNGKPIRYSEVDNAKR